VVSEAVVVGGSVDAVIRAVGNHCDVSAEEVDDDEVVGA